MNNSLERLIEGMIASLRNDIIPNVSDAYARGQAIGVVDMLNTIAARTEWSRSPILSAIEARQTVIRDVRRLLPGAAATDSMAAVDFSTVATSNELVIARNRLDAELCDLIAIAFAEPSTADENVLHARDLLREHMHADAETEMKLTRKPLFAEIAKGGGG